MSSLDPLIQEPELLGLLPEGPEENQDLSIVVRTLEPGFHIFAEHHERFEGASEYLFVKDTTLGMFHLLLMGLLIIF